MKQTALFAHRYAKALFQIGIEDDQCSEIAEQLQAFAKQLEEYSELKDVFLNPIYSPKQRVAIVSEVTEKLSFLANTRKFLHFLIEKKRTELYLDICEQYQELLDTRNGVVHVHVSSAQPLDNAAQDKLKQIFAQKTGKTILLHSEVDPTLIGGMVTRVGNRIYDGSVKSRISNMKNHLLSQIA